MSDKLPTLEMLKMRPMSSPGPGFKISGGKGFHISFENGWVVSVQFGPGNYCDNYDREISREDIKSGSEGSGTAECAVWPGGGQMVEYKGWANTVSNRSTPAEVLELLNWAASQPKVAP